MALSTDKISYFGKQNKWKSNIFSANKQQRTHAPARIAGGENNFDI